MSASSPPPLLDVRHLSIDFVGPEKTRLKAVEDVSFTLHPGEMLGLVGESGCGKTTLMLALLRLLPVAGRIVGGQILFQGRDLLAEDCRAGRSPGELPRSDSMGLARS